MSVATREKPWQTTGEARSSYVRTMFSDIAPVYDLINTVMTAGSHRRWRRKAVRLLPLDKGERALDLCCGTGDFAFDLRAAGAGLVLGVDFAQPMLDIAKRKSAGTSLRWAMADALRLPLADGSVHVITVGWGLRNLADIPAGLREMRRVLADGGRFVVLDIARPKGVLARPARFYFYRVVPLIGAALGWKSAYTYLPNSLDHFPDRDELKRLTLEAGFRVAETHDLAFGMLTVLRGVK